MESEIHIVVQKVSPNSPWMALWDGAYSELKLAENRIECMLDQKCTYQLGIVSGVVSLTRKPSALEDQ